MASAVGVRKIRFSEMLNGEMRFRNKKSAVRQLQEYGEEIREFREIGEMVWFQFGIGRCQRSEYNPIFSLSETFDLKWP